MKSVGGKVYRKPDEHMYVDLRMIASHRLCMSIEILPLKTSLYSIKDVIWERVWYFEVG